MIRADLWSSVNAGWNLIEFKSVKLRIKLRNMHGFLQGRMHIRRSFYELSQISPPDAPI